MICDKCKKNRVTNRLLVICNQCAEEESKKIMLEHQPNKIIIEQSKIMNGWFLKALKDDEMNYSANCPSFNNVIDVLTKLKKDYFL